MHHAVEATEGVPRFVRHCDGAVEVAEIRGPQTRVRCVNLTLSQYGLEAILAAGDDADGGAALGQEWRQRGADARRRAGDQDLRTRDVHALLPNSDVRFQERDGRRT